MVEPTVGQEPPSVGREALRCASSDVVTEYLAGRWPELVPSRLLELRAFLLNELLDRCPGFSTREYRVALTTRLVTRGIVLQVRRALIGSGAIR